MKFANVKNDMAFRKIFGNQLKKEVLISFLNAVLDFENGHEIEDVTIINPIQLPQFKDGKATIIDIKARDQSGREFIIEMQVANRLGFSKRVLYYASAGYVSQIERGEFYENLNPTVFIGILDFNISENPNFLSRHRILNVETGECVLKDMEFNFIELPKFNKEPHEIEKLAEKWIYFIKEATKLTIIPEKFDDKGLKIAFEEANIQTWSKDEIQAYNYAGIRETDERLQIAFALNEGMEKGIEKGIEKGAKQAAMNTAKQMKSDGFSPEIIEKYTGLSIQEIQNL
jgi:predicted transposase/invertase (TIGR01784 family)